MQLQQRFMGGKHSVSVNIARQIGSAKSCTSGWRLTHGCSEFSLMIILLYWTFINEWNVSKFNLRRNISFNTFSIGSLQRLPFTYLHTVQTVQTSNHKHSGLNPHKWIEKFLKKNGRKKSEAQWGALYPTQPSVMVSRRCSCSCRPRLFFFLPQKNGLIKSAKWIDMIRKEINKNCNNESRGERVKRLWCAEKE